MEVFTYVEYAHAARGVVWYVYLFLFNASGRGGVGREKVVAMLAFHSIILFSFLCSFKLKLLNSGVAAAPSTSGGFITFCALFFIFRRIFPSSTQQYNGWQVGPRFVPCCIVDARLCVHLYVHSIPRRLVHSTFKTLFHIPILTNKPKQTR